MKWHLPPGWVWQSSTGPPSANSKRNMSADRSWLSVLSTHLDVYLKAHLLAEPRTAVRKRN